MPVRVLSRPRPSGITRTRRALVWTTASIRYLAVCAVCRIGSFRLHPRVGVSERSTWETQLVAESRAPAVRHSAEGHGSPLSHDVRRQPGRRSPFPPDARRAQRSHLEDLSVAGSDSGGREDPGVDRSRIHQSETPIERAHSAVESQRSASGRKVMAGVTSRYGGASSRSALGDPRIEEPLHFAREDDQRPIRKRAVCVGIEGRAPTSAVPTQTSRRSESRRQAGSLRHGRVVAPLRYLQ